MDGECTQRFLNGRRGFDIARTSAHALPVRWVAKRGAQGGWAIASSGGGGARAPSQHATCNAVRPSVSTSLIATDSSTFFTCSRSSSVKLESSLPEP